MRSRSPRPADESSQPIKPIKPADPANPGALPAAATGAPVKAIAKAKPTASVDASASAASAGGKAKRRKAQVLIVDDEPAIREVLAEALGASSVSVHHASTVAEARAAMGRAKIDLVLLDVALPDGDGVSLADELRAADPGLESIVMTGMPSVQRAVDAMRAGACDFLSKPFDLAELNRCVDGALRRRADQAKNDKRVTRLKRLCRKLNRARHEVTQQVDILCNDLVTAYQELAGQMRHVQMTTQFQTTIEQELDLEQVLRRALEFVLQHIGPTNAVVFLPGRGESHTVGGYINYTFDKSTADVLLSHLADVAAGRIAESEGPIHLSDDAQINLWLSDDSAWLADCQVLAIPCRNDEDEVMANLMLFRDATESFSDEHAETLMAMAPIFATQLSKVIGVHHRAKPADDEPGEEWDDGEVPF